ncbi:O-antigen ligase family protein [Patescibacteria group bacterium]
MTLAISLLAGVAIGALAIKNRLWAVALVLFLLPTYLVRFSIIGIPMTMLEIMVLVLFVVYLGQEGLKGFAHLKKIHWLMFFILLAAGVFGLLTTPDLRAGAGVFKAYLVEPMLFFIVFTNTVKTMKDVRLVVWALGLSAFVVAIVAAMQFVTGWGIPDPWHDFPDRRATAFFGFPNAIGLYIAPILTLFVGLLLHVKFFTRRNVLFVLSLILFLVFALVVARVEGGFVAAAAGIFVMLLFTKWRWWAIGAVVVGGIALFAYEPTREILLFQDVSGDVRLALWQGTWNLLKSQPVFGAGLGAFPIVYDVYRLPSHVELLQYPHNIFLNFWVELGVVGLVWLVATLVAFFTKAVRSLKRTEGYSIVLIGVMVSVIVYGLVDVLYFKNDLSILFWVWLGLLCVTTKAKSER